MSDKLKYLGGVSFIPLALLWMVAMSAPVTKPWVTPGRRIAYVGTLLSLLIIHFVLKRRQRPPEVPHGK